MKFKYAHLDSVVYHHEEDAEIKHKRLGDGYLKILKQNDNS